MKKAIILVLTVIILLCGLSLVYYLKSAALQRLQQKKEVLTAVSYKIEAFKHFKKGEYEEAMLLFKKAHDIDPGNDIVKQYLSILFVTEASGHLERRDYNQAEQILKKALEFNENNIDAYIFLGDVKYYTQQLPEARKYWQKAYSLNPESEVVNERLSILNKQYTVEKEFKSEDYWSFKVAFEDSLKRIDSYHMRDLLWEAYRKIGQDFAYFPETKIMVLFYPHEEYMKMTGFGKAVRGHYDGKIRIPILEKKEELEVYRPTIWHEYTHAIIHILAPDKVPLWLNEGLALYEENKAKPLDLKLLRKAVKQNALIPMNKLETYFLSFDDPAKTELAYQESFTLADYIIERFSLWHVKNILLKLGETDKDFSEAVKEELYTSLGRLEKDWLKYIEKKYH